MARPAHYSGLQIGLHWLVGVVVLGLIVVGIIMVNLGQGALTNTLYEMHKTFGIIVFALAVLRAAVRLLRGAPAMEATLPSWQRQLASATHGLLYILIVLVPVLGFVGTAMCCAPVNLFWTIPVPISIPGGMDGAKPILAAHKLAALTLAAIVALHIAGALYHALVRRDGVMARMWPAARG